jgi:ADP-ribose pyrophosphatase YjhB (NUDIX family)
VTHQDKILLGKRNINPGKGMWSLPGGYVNRTEKVEAAAIREIKEETNLDIKLATDDLLGVYSATGNPHVLIVYQTQLAGPEIAQLANQPEEVSELAFFGLDALPSLAFMFEEQILADWSKRRNIHV